MKSRTASSRHSLRLPSSRRQGSNYPWRVFLSSIALWRLVVVFTVFLWGFAASLWVPGDFSEFTYSAAVYWDGGAGTSDWNTAANWNPDGVPTSSDDVTVTSTVNIVTSAAISFSTLSIGQDSGTTFATTTISHAITSGGSITIKNQGSLIQNTTTQLSITGTLLIESGGILTHTANTSAQNYEVDISGATVTLNAGGTINVDGKGYTPSSISGGTGNGTGGGRGSGAAAGAGGAHAGNGGTGLNTGGTGYCDLTAPVTIGSAGGNGSTGDANSGGTGGGLVILNATGTLTVNGTVSAKGSAPSSGNSGGGAGGGVSLTAGTIAGTPQSFTVIGGAGGASNGGGGGGGCVLLSYTTSNSISPTSGISMAGGAGDGTGQRGGVGVVYAKQSGTNGDLYAIGSGSSPTSTTQGATSITADTLTLITSPTYVVPSGKTLTLRATSPFSANDATGTLNIRSGSTFVPTSTTSFTVASTTLNIDSGSAITASTSIAMIVDYGGTLTQSNFATTSPAQPLSTLYVKNGGIVNHTANTSAQTHVINLSITSSTVAAGGTINVDGKGYTPSASSGGTGNGTGGGRGSGSGAGAGGAHAGNGGTGLNSGGVGYCDLTAPGTIGSAGGNGSTGDANSGGKGGGLIVLNVTGTLTINGTISAQGAAPTAGNSGGGAGGGVSLTAGTIAGTPQSFTVLGGAGGATGGGGGGGGCVLLSYTTSNSISPTSGVSMGGGAGDGSGLRGGAGVVYTKQTGTDGDLFVISSGSSPTSTPQGASSITASSLTMSTSPTYVVPTGKTLVLKNSSPFSSGDATGVLQLNSGATFTPTSTTDFVVASSTLQLDAGATFTASSSLTMVVDYGGTFDMRSYATSTSALPLSTLYIKNGGILTHGANTTAQTNVINLTVSSSTVAVGGSINLDGKGYGSSSNGPGEGINSGVSSGSGAGHGGAGGAGANAAGSAYCVSTNPGTIGSSGGSGNGGAGGAGGGLLVMNVSNTFTLNGTITAKGNTGAGTNGGGGAGGGLKITAESIVGSPQSITVAGGTSGSSAGGGGGGGCAYISYASSNVITSAATTKSGGTGGTNNGSAGTYDSIQTNASPTGPSTLYANNTTAQSGSTNPSFLSDTTPAFSSLYNDANAGDIANKARIQVSTDSAFSSITHWDSGSSGTTITNCTVGNRCQDLVYGSFGTAPTTNLSLNDDVDENSQTTYYWRMKYFDDEPAEGSFSTSTATFTLLDIPNEPTSLTTSSLAATSVGLAWVDSSSLEDNFELQISTDGTTFSSSASPAASATSATVSSLSANTQYTFRIRAVNTAGNSSYATSTAFYTLANVPTSVSATADSANAITVSWSANSNSPSTSYELRNETTGQTITGLSTTSYTVTGLSENTTYVFSVRAVNSENKSTSYSSSASARTASSTGTSWGGSSGGTEKWEPKITPSNPTGAAFLINGGAKETKTRTVTITILQKNVSEIAISNTQDFLKSTWQQVADPRAGIPWTILAGAGEKVVYVKFMNLQGNVSDVYRASIILEENIPPEIHIDTPTASSTVLVNINNAGDRDYRKLTVFGHGVYKNTSTKLTLYRKGKNKDPKTGAVVEHVVELSSQPLFPVAISDAQKKWLVTFSDIPYPGEHRLVLTVTDSTGKELQKLVRDFFIESAATGTPGESTFVLNDSKPITNTARISWKATVPKGRYYWISHEQNQYSPDALKTFKDTISGTYDLPDRDDTFTMYFRVFDVHKNEIFRKLASIKLDAHPPLKPRMFIYVSAKKIRMRGMADPMTTLVVVKEDLRPSVPSTPVAPPPTQPRPRAQAPLLIAATTTKYTKASSTGTWQIEFTDVPDGDYQITAYAIDDADNRGESVSATVSVYGEPVAPSTPAEPQPVAPAVPARPRPTQPAPVKPSPTPASDPSPVAPTAPGTPFGPPASEPVSVPVSAPGEGGGTVPDDIPAGTSASPSLAEPGGQGSSTPLPADPTAQMPGFSVKAGQAAVRAIQGVRAAATQAVQLFSTAIGKAAKSVQQFADNPRVEQATEQAVTPTIATVAVLNVAAAVAAAQTLPSYLYLIFTQPAYLLHRRKRKSWGVVYNAFTKMPVDLVLVRLLDAQSNRVVQTRVTDIEGRFAFFVRPGSYRIEVDKPGFSFPAAFLQGKKEDGQYLDLYHGDTITIEGTEPAYLTPSLALQSGEDTRPVTKITKDQAKKALQNIIGVSGTAVAVVSVIINPSPWVVGALGVHILSYFLFRRLAVGRRPKQWGVVEKSDNKMPIKQAVVRLFDAQYNKLLETQVTTSDGRYAFLVGPNTYYVVYEKEGYARHKTDPIPIEKPASVIARNEILEKNIAVPPSTAPTPVVTPVAIVSAPSVSAPRSLPKQPVTTAPAMPVPVVPSVGTATLPEDTAPPMYDISALRDRAQYGGKDS